MKIGNKTITTTSEPLIIAEVAQTHDGSLGQAFSFIDIAKDCGADAIKFQTHIADQESTPNEPWRIKFSHQDDSRYDYWKRMEFSKEQWRLLKAYADEKNIIFLSSPFSKKAFLWLDEIGVTAWKMASGEVYNAELIELVIKSGKPVIMSSGLSTVADTKNLAQNLIKQNVDVAVLHCTTQYPTQPESIGMNVFEHFKSELKNTPVGLSDHSGEIYPAIIATYQGASIIEVHLTMHQKMFGPDVSSSLTPDQLTELIKGVKFAWKMRSHPINKDEQLLTLAKEKNIFGRSLVAANEIPQDKIIQADDLIYKKPGGGIAFENKNLLIGKRALNLLPKNTMIRLKDVE